MNAVVVLVTGLLGSAPVVAQTPPAPAEIAAARAEGDALLKAAHAEDLFDNETGGAYGAAIILRHKPSGFRCVFNPGKPHNRVDVARSLTRGDDVGCITDTFSDARELILTRAPEKSPEQALAEEAQIIALARPENRPYTPKPGVAPVFGAPPGVTLPKPLTASFRSATSADRIVLGKVGPWLVIYRFHDGPQVADLGPVLDSFWTTTVLEGQRHAANAAATGPAASAKPGTPAPRLDPRAEAEAILQRGAAADVFEVAAANNLPALRHKPSGFVCTFEPGSPDNSVSIFPGPPRGTDVGCTTRAAGAIVSNFVTKLPAPMGTQQALEDFMIGVRRAHPDVQPSPGNFPTASLTGTDPSLPEHRTVRMTYTQNGERVFSRLSVALVRGWAVEQRITAAINDALVADLMGEVSMAAELSEMTKAGSAPPK